ncbi:MAG: hypothetical protein WC314_01925 [Vulcanimicrobiota bacterium]
MSDSDLYEAAVRVARELSELRSRMIRNTNDPTSEPDAQSVAEVCRRFAKGYRFELLERESFLGLIIKLIDPKGGQFCMIAPDEPPTQVENAGKKNYTFHLELNIRHTLELEAEDMLAAQDEVFDLVEDLVVGECDEVSISFMDDEESFGPGFSLN